jgi:hypothetical protein
MPRPLTGIKADRKHSYASIESITAALREKLELNIGERFDARNFFDQVLPGMTLKTRNGPVCLREAIGICHATWDEVEFSFVPHLLLAVE